MQKVKHLEYEHTQSCETVKLDARDNMDEERNHHTLTEKENLDDKKERKNAYQISEKSNIAEVEEKELNLKKDIEELTEDLEIQKCDLIT